MYFNPKYARTTAPIVAMVRPEAKRTPCTGVQRVAALALFSAGAVCSCLIPRNVGTGRLLPQTHATCAPAWAAVMRTAWPHVQGKRYCVMCVVRKRLD